MKGLQEATATGTKYIQIKHHSICEESREPREGFEAVEVQNPRTKESITKYIKKYKGVEGLVCKIEWYEREYEDTAFRGWKLHLDAAGVPCVLDLPFSSRAASRFMKLAERIDFSEPVEFAAWYDKKTDSTAFNVKQNGQSVPQKYTKDEPGDCPPPTKKRLGGWDFSAQNEYLYDTMLSVVIPAVAAAGNEMPSGEPAYAQAASIHQVTRPALPLNDDDDSEIPF